MPANKNPTRRNSKNNVVKSDLARVDKYRLTRADYDEIPEWTAADLARARHHIGGKPVRGRPKLEEPKKTVSIRLDSDVLEHFKKGGANYQSRINAALRKAAGLKATASPDKDAAKR